MMLPYPFGDLSKRVRRENNWLTQNYYGIKWFDGKLILNTLQLQDITRHVRYIYSRGHEKASYLSNLFSKNVNNLEGIFPTVKNLLDFEGCIQRCTHHGFRTNVESHCALRNAYKLKRWLTIRNSSNSSYDSFPLENWSESDVKKIDNKNFSI